MNTKPKNLEEKREDIYCASGCGCSYPNGDGLHEGSCVWEGEEIRRQSSLPKNLEELRGELIEKFKNEIYGENDALFDRNGNNVSHQVEYFLNSTITRIAEETLEAVEERCCENCYHDIESGVVLTLYKCEDCLCHSHKTIQQQKTKAEEWLKGGGVEG